MLVSELLPDIAAVVVISCANGGRVIRVRMLADLGLKPNSIARDLRERGVVVTGAAICYHVGLRKQKPVLKDYEYFLRRDSQRRGVRYEKPKAREKGLWS